MKRFPPRSDTLVSNLCETPSPQHPTLEDKLANRMTPERAMHSHQAPCTASMIWKRTAQIALSARRGHLNLLPALQRTICSSILFPGLG